MQYSADLATRYTKGVQWRDFMGQARWAMSVSYLVRCALVALLLVTILTRKTCPEARGDMPLI